jgi:deoxyadenosine/deoxycytidine kinase
MLAIISRIRVLKNAIKNHPDAIIVSERSLYSDRNIFAEMLYHEGKIDPHSFQIYILWFEEYIKELPEHQYIYLISDPKNTNERIIKRNRKGEDNIDINYLITCNDYHKKWLTKDYSKIILEIFMDDYNYGTKEYNQLIIDTVKLINNKKKYNFKLIKAYLIGISSFLLLYSIKKFF